MRYISFRDARGALRVGAIDRGDPTVVLDLTAGVPQGAHGPMRRLIEAASAGAWRAEEALRTVTELPRADVVPIAPVPDPSKIVAAPVNYRNHQAEMSSDSQIDALGVFLKAPSSATGHESVVRLPYTDRRFDQEGEFAVVIGRPARHVRAADALQHVFGFTSLLDMTMRGGEDRSVRKSFDTFTPMGPTLVTPDEVQEIDELELKLWVNGTLRQRADLADLIWDVPRLIAYASSVMTLLPGDVLTTGTPEGVGAVRDGDRIELEITGLDRLAVGVSSAGAVPCPTLGAGRGPRPPSELTPVRPRT